MANEEIIFICELFLVGIRWKCFRLERSSSEVNLYRTVLATARSLAQHQTLNDHTIGYLSNIFILMECSNKITPVVMKKIISE